MSEISKRDIAYLFFKRKNQMLLAFAAALAFSAVASYTGSRTYQASATVYVVRQLPPIAATGPSSYNAILDRREVLNSEVELITSRAVAEKVAVELGLGAPATPAAGAGAGRNRPAPSPVVRAIRFVSGSFRSAMLAAGLVDPPGDRQDGIVAGLLGGVSATPGLNSSLITVAFRADNPDFAARAANAFTRVYLEERLKLLQRPGLEAFYEQQVARAKETAVAIQSQLQTVKKATGMVSADEQLRLALAEQSRLNAQIRDAESAKVESEQRIAALRRRVDAEPDSVVSSRLVQRSPELATLERQRLDLEAQRAVELNRFSENSAPIQEIDRSLARVRAALAKEPPTVVSSESTSPNGVRSSLLTDLYRAESDGAAAAARERALRSRLETVDADVRRMDDDAADLRSMADAAGNANRIYETYVRQQEEARMAAQTGPGVTNVQVVSPATKPGRPRYPRLVEILAGAVLGLILAIGYAFVAEVFSQTLDRRGDVERELDLPVLASIPHVDSNRLSIGS